jgi:hypothetical protein
MNTPDPRTRSTSRRQKLAEERYPADMRLPGKTDQRLEAIRKGIIKRPLRSCVRVSMGEALERGEACSLNEAYMVATAPQRVARAKRASSPKSSGTQPSSSRSASTSIDGAISAALDRHFG